WSPPCHPRCAVCCGTYITHSERGSFWHRFLRNVFIPWNAELSSVGDQGLNSRFFVQLNVKLSEHVAPFANFVTFLPAENSYGFILGQNSTWRTSRTWPELLPP